MGVITTTQGREVPHCHMPQSPCKHIDFNAGELADARAWMDRHFPDATELEPASRRFNCHGFAYARVHGGWFNRPTLFNEDDYVEVQTPRKGDIVSYFNHRGRLAHSAVVEEITEGQITQLSSKWGEGPAVLHELLEVPSDYGQPKLIRRRKP